jgi:hypothetical protein
MKVIKSRTYNVVSTDPFDIPLPLEFELMSGNAMLASYKIHESGQVDYQFNGATKEKILTSTTRPLELNDIYFLFSSRVVPDKTPFTQEELDRFGLDEYNPYDILRKTHGILPNCPDCYWIKFAGEELTYKVVSKKFKEFYAETDDSSESEEVKTEEVTEKKSEALFSVDSLVNQKSHEYTSINDVGSIMNEGKLDVGALAIDDTPVSESVFAPSVKKPTA